jgi:hypothetical protein
MLIFLKPKQIAYSWPAVDSMNIAFFESKDCDLVVHESNVLEVQVDVQQAKGLIQQLTEFCIRKGALPNPEINYQHSAKHCPCESCESHRQWYCPTCDSLMSSPESTRCVNGHERRLAQKR